MLLAGDEQGHSQQGNNNAYCGTTPPRLDWSTADDALTDYVAALIALRRRIPALQQDRWWQQDDGSVQWLNAQGQVLDAQQWEQGDLFMQILLSQRWLLLVNATPQTVEMRLPEGDWQVVAPFTQEDSRAVLPAETRARFAFWYGNNKRSPLWLGLKIKTPDVGVPAAD